jgi:hypothetical protein
LDIKTDLISKLNFYIKKMSFHTSIVPMSRSELQNLPEKRRKDAIAFAVNQVFMQVTAAATDGKVFCIVNISDVTRDQTGIRSSPARYIPTASDMVWGLQDKFPDCKVEYTEMWEDTKPGLRQQKKGVLVDWS